MISLKITKGTPDTILLNGDLYVKITQEASDLLDKFDLEADESRWRKMSASEIHEAVYGHAPDSRAKEVKFSLDVLARLGLTRSRSGYLVPPLKSEDLDDEDFEM